MKYKVKLSLITDDGNEIETEEIFEFKKENERIEHIGGFATETAKQGSRTL